MSNSRSLHQVQLVDLELSEQRERLRLVEASLGETEELRAARQVAQEAGRELKALQQRLHSQEMDLADLTNKIKAEETRLYSGDVRNPKELSGIQEEVWYLKRRHEEMEEEILSTMLDMDEAEQTLSVLSSRLREVETRWANDQTCLQEERESLRSQLSELAGRREGLAAMIGQEELAVYEELRAKKGGQAVAALEGGICRGCGVGLPTSKVRQAQQGQALTFCDNCGRILHPLG